VGTPLDLYNLPADKFVAAFIGSPAMNFIEGEITGDGSPQLKSPFTTIPIPDRFKNALKESASHKMTLGIRPEDVFTEMPDDNTGRFHKIDGVIEVMEPLGNEIIFHITCGDQVVVARERSDREGSPGASISVYLDLDRIHLFDAGTNKALPAS
jgi:multiple sugar transport system ATP-binding protein